MKLTSKIFQGLFFFLLMIHTPAIGEDGYQLWLRYEPVSDASRLKEYTTCFKALLVEGSSRTMEVARDEIFLATKGLLGKSPSVKRKIETGTLIIGAANSGIIASLNLSQELSQINDEGFIILSRTIEGKPCTVIAAKNDTGVLYGVFHLLRLMQSNQSVRNLTVINSPSINHRVLNHWDNLDRTVERGYAGFSLWDWHKLPDFIDPRYTDYARANASIGINGTVLTNVNANAQVLTPQYLKKVAALADVFRPYGIKVYLTARFSSPVEIGALPTADPLNDDVRKWWKDKVREIYQHIPDFGGFLVKANSEGQPGPQNYKRNHADGANMLAEALAPYKGIVMWRAFVYDNEVPVDRAKQAYHEFKPLDGKFNSNVLVQVKNGPIDFQPREPYHPLFGAMPGTPLMMEFQITQEYLGFATHLVYLAPLFKECLNADTYANGKGSTVAKVVDGSLDQHALTGIAGVANIGTDRNWCGHPFGQANWYAFGRLAWNHELTADEIADEWIRMTFTNQTNAVKSIKSMMLSSRETAVNYMTPLGLHHIMGWNHHYGPAPWIRDKPRADWTSVYYHQADSAGIGFDRTTSGSDALEQYPLEVQQHYGSLQNCPETYLLWFHHLPWTYKMKSGRTLWDEMCFAYYQGAADVSKMQVAWKSVASEIDRERFVQVNELLAIQQQEANWWRNACVLYFQSRSKMPIPSNLEPPDHTLEYYQALEFPFAPGIRPKW
jgi:alpha-glucuronidase